MANALYILLNRSDSTVPVESPEDFQRPPVTRSVNALWFLSLSLALIVALLSILAKQWLNEYTRRMRKHVASHRQWVWRHLVFNAGLDKWGMNVFISALPVLLHAALFLFLIGLSVSLSELDWVAAGFVLVPTSFTAAIYAFTSFAPLWYGDCPTATPLLRQSRLVVEKLWTTGHWLALRIRSIFRHGAYEQGSLPNWDPPAYDEEELLRGKEAHRNAAALGWMLKSLPALDEVAIAQEAIGSLDILEHYVAFHEHNQHGLVTPRADDPLCQPSQRHLIMDRLGRMDTTYSPDVGEMARCIRSTMFAGPLSIENSDHLLVVMSKGDDSTHDLHSFIRILLPVYTTPLAPENLRLWLQQQIRPDSSPILMSTAAILFHSSGVPSTMEQAAVVSNFCDLVLPFISNHGDEEFVARRAAVVFMVHHFRRWILMTVEGVQVPANPDELRLLALDTLLAIATGPTTEVISDQAKFMASVSVLRLLADTDARHVPATRSSGISHTIRTVNSEGWDRSDVLEQQVPQFVCSFLSSNCGCDTWSAALGELLHCSAVQFGDMDWMARHLFASWPTEDCQKIAQVLGQRYSAADIAILESKANLLALGTSDSSWWDLFWEQYMTIDRGIDVMKLVIDLVIHLCLLKRSDADVDELAQNLLGTDRGLEIVLRSLPDISGIAKFVQHARELAPHWWRQTRQTILALPRLDQRYKQFEQCGTVPQDFVQRIDDLPQCTQCPAHGITFRVPAADAASALIATPRARGGLGRIRQVILPRINVERADTSPAADIGEEEGLEMGLRIG